MEHNKENVIKLLEAMSRDAYELYKDSDEKFYITKCTTIDMIIDILRNEKDFNDYVKIYKDVIE